MASSTPKILGQAQGIASTVTTVYTAPTAANGFGEAANGAIVSTLFLANNHASNPAKVTVYLTPSSASTTDLNIILPATNVPADDTIVLTAGICLAPGDRISAKSDTGNVVFTACGTEVYV